MIRFLRASDGTTIEGQHWNPDMLSRKDRRIVAQSLREAADGIERDLFLVDGEYKKFPVKPKRKAAK